MTSGFRFQEEGAKENAHMESFNRRFKEENRQLFWEREHLTPLRVMIHQRIRYYVPRHSTSERKE